MLTEGKDAVVGIGFPPPFCCIVFRFELRVYIYMYLYICVFVLGPLGGNAFNWYWEKSVPLTRIPLADDGHVLLYIYKFKRMANFFLGGKEAK